MGCFNPFKNAEGIKIDWKRNAKNLDFSNEVCVNTIILNKNLKIIYLLNSAFMIISGRGNWPKPVKAAKISSLKFSEPLIFSKVLE